VVNHLGEFFFLPNFVAEMTVGADGKYIYIQRLEFLVSDGNCRQFGRSNKGEVAGIETDQEPVAFVFGELDQLEAAVVEGHRFEVRGGLAYTSDHTRFLLRWYW
jgi:hypothetical protein